MKPYLSVKATEGSFYTCFVYLWNCGKLAEFSPITSNHDSRAELHRKSSKVLNSTFQIR